MQQDFDTGQLFVLVALAVAAENTLAAAVVANSKQTALQLDFVALVVVAVDFVVVVAAVLPVVVIYRLRNGP